MNKILDQFNKIQLKNMPDLKSGYTVKVHQKIKEGDKERIQIFEGIIIAKKHGKGIPATITVRKITDGIGIERIFPIHSPSIEKIEVVQKGKVRRSKLYYLRIAKGKKAKLKKKGLQEAIVEEPAEEIIAEETEIKEPTIEVPSKEKI
jgi:large subunit ribosomal protein L19